MLDELKLKQGETGTYTLQSNRAKFNQYNVSPICQLCNKDPETREHFLTCCETLQNIRSVYLSKIRYLFEPSSDKINSILDDPAKCTQVLLDSSHPDIENILSRSVNWNYTSGNSSSRYT